jgi:hypothetical protein
MAVNLLRKMERISRSGGSSNVNCTRASAAKLSCKCKDGRMVNELAIFRLPSFLSVLEDLEKYLDESPITSERANTQWDVNTEGGGRSLISYIGILLTNHSYLV